MQAASAAGPWRAATAAAAAIPAGSVVGGAAAPAAPPPLRRGLYDGRENQPTVLPTDEEALKRAKDPPPLEEQLPGGADAADLKHASTDAGEGFVLGAKKAGPEGGGSDVVT